MTTVQTTLCARGMTPAPPMLPHNRTHIFLHNPPIPSPPDRPESDPARLRRNERHRPRRWHRAKYTRRAPVTSRAPECPLPGHFPCAGHFPPEHRCLLAGRPSADVSSRVGPAHHQPGPTLRDPKCARWPPPPQSASVFQPARPRRFANSLAGRGAVWDAPAPEHARLRGKRVQAPTSGRGTPQRTSRGRKIHQP